MKELMRNNLLKIKQVDIPVRFLWLQVMVILTFIAFLAI